MPVYNLLIVNHASQEFGRHGFDFSFKLERKSFCRLNSVHFFLFPSIAKIIYLLDANISVSQNSVKCS